jgi:deoxyribose-phosphate aldolase
MDDILTPEQAARIALRCLDLTSLNDADDEAAIARLCQRAQGEHGAVAAVCVWPRFAALARSLLPPQIAVAAVANFPAGATDIDAALRDVHEIVDAGAQEVDMVLPWRALRDGDAAAAEVLLRAVRRACAGLRLKVILETGELQDEALIARASVLALEAGADMLKTSTGKTPHGASLHAAEVMLSSIAAHPTARDRAGLKVSGGIRRVADALPYLMLCRSLLGAAALQPSRFRIGASSLLDDIEAQLGGSVAAPAAKNGY